MFKQCYDFDVECTSITRCNRVHCSTYTDQTCLLCNSGYHPSGQICAREFNNLSKIYKMRSLFLNMQLWLNIVNIFSCKHTITLYYFLHVLWNQS